MTALIKDMSTQQAIAEADFPWEVQRFDGRSGFVAMATEFDETELPGRFAEKKDAIAATLLVAGSMYSYELFRVYNKHNGVIVGFQRLGDGRLELR